MSQSVNCCAAVRVVRAAASVGLLALVVVLRTAVHLGGTVLGSSVGHRRGRTTTSSYPGVVAETRAEGRADGLHECQGPVRGVV